MLRNLLISFANMICSKKVNYLIREYVFSFGNFVFPKKIDYLLRKYDFFVRKYDFSKKSNYLLRKYNLFIQKYDFFNKAPPVLWGGESANPLRVASTTGPGGPWAQYIRTRPEGSQGVSEYVECFVYLKVHFLKLVFCKLFVSAMLCRQPFEL